MEECVRILRPADPAGSPGPAHPWSRRWNALTLRVLGGYLGRRYDRTKAGLFRDLPTELVELGPGVGANFRYYPRGARVLAVEPNRHTHRWLRVEAERRGLSLELVPATAERLPFATGSVGLVVATLVLCSVRNPGDVIREVLRVLRPGGQFLAIEHVAAAGPLDRRVQRVLAPAWRWCFDGCELCRDPAELLATAGFAVTRIDRLQLPALVRPIRSQVVARCTR